jgi:hypothetical protein
MRLAPVLSAHQSDPRFFFAHSAEQPAASLDDVTSPLDRKRKLEPSPVDTVPVVPGAEATTGFDSTPNSATETETCRIQAGTSTAAEMQPCNVFLAAGWRDVLCHCVKCKALLSSLDSLHFLSPAPAPGDDGLESVFPVDPDAGLSTTLSTFCQTKKKTTKKHRINMT